MEGLTCTLTLPPHPVCTHSIKVLHKCPAAVITLQKGILLTCVSWSPHEPVLLACGAMDGSVSLWRLRLNSDEDNFHFIPVPLQILLDISRVGMPSSSTASNYYYKLLLLWLKQWEWSNLNPNPDHPNPVTHSPLQGVSEPVGTMTRAIAVMILFHVLLYLYVWINVPGHWFSVACFALSGVRMTRMCCPP